MLFKTVTWQKNNHLLLMGIRRSVNTRAEIALLSDELSELCSEIIRDEEIRVILLNDIGQISFGMRSGETISGDDEEIPIGSIAGAIAKLDQPIIGTLDGDVIGYGLELALVCDIRIASETSRFGLPHVSAGLIPRDGGTQRLPRLVGRGKALELILTGETIDAREAFRIGLVSRIVPSNELISVATDIATEMASKAPIALRYTKEAVHKGMDLTLEQGLRLEADLYFLIHTTQDRTEGIQAFRQKRTPTFGGK